MEETSINSITNYFHFYPKAITSRNPVKSILNRLQKEASGQIKLGLDLQGGTEFLVSVDVSNLEEEGDIEGAVTQVIEIIRKRVDRFGVSEPIIFPEGENRIRIQLPGLTEAEKEQARETIKKTAFLEFRLVHPDNERLLEDQLAIPGYELLSMKPEELPNGTFQISKMYVQEVDPEKQLTGKNVKRAGVIRDPLTNQPEITFSLDSEGTSLFADTTTASVGRRLAIVLDGEIYSAPNINTPITGGRGSISGDFTDKEAYQLANVLQNPLENPVSIEEERGVDPSLGQDSINSGVKAALYGMTAIAAFMTIYYLVAGLIANFALLLNMVLLLGVMCSIDAVMTLPGIAGIVLTLGMAVDANVLIFERIREEQAAGKSLQGSIESGYGKAFSTILDANITTLIASIILINLGNGPVKGFGVTLTIGIVASMFTSLFVTRLVFDTLLKRKALKEVKMLQILRKPNFDFLKYSKPAFIASWTLVLIGLIVGLVRGSDTMGVDFLGGDSLTLKFTQKVEVSEVRTAIEGLGFGDPNIQYQRDLSNGKETLRIVAKKDEGAKIEETLRSQFSEAGFQRIKLDSVGASVGSEILKSALIAVFLSLFGVLIYVAFRYEFSFAIGAVLAILHDVMMTLGVFFIFGRELSAPMVAAILAIIGFSINDTIVIFDRIREDLKLGVRGSFKEIINMALNQTMSRTLITSGTSLLASCSLLIFGGGIINDFAFTFTVGIITGTFSSIYIASALMFWWNKGERPNMSAQVYIEESVEAAKV